MKKIGSSKSRLISGIAIIFTIFSISGSCTKTMSDESGQGVTLGPTSKNTVSVSEGSYYPSEVTITAGDMITWKNTGTHGQTVTSDSGLFDGILGINGTFSYTFSSAGTYQYHSRTNPAMTGSVVVN